MIDLNSSSTNEVVNLTEEIDPVYNNTNMFIQGVLNRMRLTLTNVPQESWTVNRISNDSSEIINLLDDEEILILDSPTLNNINETDIKIISEKSFQKKLSNISQTDKTFSCIICYKVKNEKYLRKLPCKHELCNRCLLKWTRIKRNCPTCRRRLTIHNIV
jgi:hypothetical protein